MRTLARFTVCRAAFNLCADCLYWLSQHFECVQSNSHLSDCYYTLLCASENPETL